VLAEISERGAAALLAARLRGDDRLAEAAIHVVDQQPGAAIRHAKLPAGLRDRAGVADRLQQRNLAGPDRPIGPEVDTHRQPRPGHGAALAKSPRGDYHRSAVRKGSTAASGKFYDVVNAGALAIAVSPRRASPDRQDARLAVRSGT